MEGKVLVAEIKSGFSRGKINAPGGKIEPKETPEEAASREFFEETGARPTGIEKAGLYRCFNGKDEIMIHVFTAKGLLGIPVETKEAAPLWVPLGEIPFDRMWAEDIHWFPYMLEGRKFAGSFTFSEDWKSILSYEVRENDG